LTGPRQHGKGSYVAPLLPVHSSMRPLVRRERIRPHNMDYIHGVTHEQGEALERIALGIFTDMTNAGATFQESLAAIYLSGLSHAIEAEKLRGKPAASAEGV